MTPARAIATSLAALLLGGAAGAQLTSVPWFDGMFSEGFETQTAPPGPCIAERVFDGTADLCTPSGSTGAVVSFWAGSCLLAAHSGGAFYGTPGGHAILTFDHPAVRFGGWFSTTGGVPGATLRFFDVQGAPIGMVAADVPVGCGWTWNGWETAPGVRIGRVDILAAQSNTGLIQLDDLEVEYEYPSLTGVPQAVPISSGGIQELALDAGIEHAGLPYLVLGSLSGTDPGTPIDGVLLPLNLDAWSFTTLLAPNSGPLTDTFGLLDEDGMATATIRVPAGIPPAMVGATFHHAFVVIELTPTLLHVVFASEAAPLALVP